MKDKVKITYKNNNQELSEEIVWVKKVKNLYRIDNIPFFAPNVALNDLIRVEIEDGEKYFDELIEPSGHSTIQTIFLLEERKNEVINKLESLGCNWEGLQNQKFISIDIPPKVDYEKVKKVLYDYFEAGILDFKESCIAH